MLLAQRSHRLVGQHAVRVCEPVSSHPDELGRRRGQRLCAWWYPCRSREEKACLNLQSYPPTADMRASLDKWRSKHWTNASRVVHPPSPPQLHPRPKVTKATSGRPHQPQAHRRSSPPPIPEHLETVGWIGSDTYALITVSASEWSCATCFLYFLLLM